MTRKSVLITAVLCGLTAVCAAQSLGDIARQQRLKKPAPATKPKVITNENIPAAGQPAPAGAAPDSASSQESGSPASANGSEKPSAAEVTARIRQQKARIAALQDHIKDVQAQMDKWKGTECNHIFYYEHPSQNACDQPQKLSAEHDRAQAQLEREQSQLQEMQEQARRLGYGNSVYDPE